jgi:Na+-transporting methylmalonyl-CoA/oxaloacetate decarboxylase gamma subunit
MDNICIILQIDPGAAGFISSYGIGGVVFMLLVYLVYRMQAMIERFVLNNEITISKLTEVLSENNKVLKENNNVLREISTIFNEIYSHASKQFDLKNKNNSHSL